MTTSEEPVKPVKETIKVTLEKSTIYLLEEEANRYYMGNKSIALNFILKDWFAEMANK